MSSSVFIYIYTLVVVSDPRVTQSTQISQKHMDVMCNIDVIMKTMCPPSHHYNGFVAAHAL